MKHFFFFLFALACCQPAFSQCKNIALDTTDEFDSVRLIAAKPINIGFMVPTEVLGKDLEGDELVEQAKLIFSYADENKIRSFFLTLGVVERKFYLIHNDYNVYLKFASGAIMKLFDVPDEGRYDRDILMWNYTHTCVVPLEIFHMLKNDRVEKIRINYKNYKSTIVLEEPQQKALQEAVLCVEERLKNDPRFVKP